MHQLILKRLSLQRYRPASEHIMNHRHVNVLRPCSDHMNTFLNCFSMLPLGNYQIRLTHTQYGKEITSKHLKLSSESTINDTSAYNRSVVICLIFQIKILFNLFNQFGVLDLFHIGVVLAFIDENDSIFVFLTNEAFINRPSYEWKRPFGAVPYIPIWVYVLTIIEYQFIIITLPRQHKHICRPMIQSPNALANNRGIDEFILLYLLTLFLHDNPILITTELNCTLSSILLIYNLSQFIGFQCFFIIYTFRLLIITIINSKDIKDLQHQIIVEIIFVSLNTISRKMYSYQSVYLLQNRT